MVQGCGGDGCRMIGNIFEGQLINCYFRDNHGNGASFSHGPENTVLSALHVFGGVFGGNRENGAVLTNGAADVSFHGCYFLLNGKFGVSADHGCTLLSNCGFENNHQAAPGFQQGDAGIRLMVFGTLVGCTAYSIHHQKQLIRAFITNELVMIGCTGSGGGDAKSAGLGRLEGRGDAHITLIGCRGAVDQQPGPQFSLIGMPRAAAPLGGIGDGGNLAQLGDYYLWVDRSGHLRIKRGMPNSDTDGKPVGA